MEAVATPPATSPGTNGVATAPFAAVDPSRVVDHLAVLLEAALGATRTELEAPGSLLSKARYPDTLQRCTRFAVDTQVALYIQQDLVPTDRLENGDTDESRMPSMQPLTGHAKY
jgi:dynein heavy chain 1, cytosolic